MSKAKLRAKYKSLRSSLSPNEVEDLSLAIANQAINLDIWNYENYHLFLSITKQHEINTEYLLNILAGKDKNIVISKSNFQDYTLSHFLLTDNTIIKINDYGIPEPTNGIQISESQIDVIFIPLLAFDNKGNRIGYGKGFYDRFLKNCRKDSIKIGLSFFEAETHIFETSKYDFRLDFCITPLKIYRFKN